MRHYYTVITFCLILFAAPANAAKPLNIFGDFLYWKTTETADWVLNNNMNSSNQQITYGTADFNLKPGFRVGIEYTNDWETSFYYTYYFTKTTASTSGNLVSTFMGGKAAQGGTTFFRTGQLYLKINYNILDLDFAKKLHVSKRLSIKPLVGIRGGWIYQRVDTSFQGSTLSITENIKNNFEGVGPKAGVEVELALKQSQQNIIKIFANFTSAYLWGQWKISDVVQDGTATQIFVNIGRRHQGAFALQSILGLKADYKNLSIKCGYEINDWFNQYQVFDDSTGSEHKNLILQGLTIGISYSL